MGDGKASSRFPASLLSTPEHAGFRLRVQPAQPVSNGVQKKIAAAEHVRSSEEQLLIDQGVRELGLLVDIFVGRLRAKMQPAAEHRASVSAFLASTSATGQAVDVRLLPLAE